MLINAYSLPILLDYNYSALQIHKYPQWSAWWSYLIPYNILPLTTINPIKLLSNSYSLWTGNYSNLFNKWWLCLRTYFVSCAQCRWEISNPWRLGFTLVHYLLGSLFCLVDLCAAFSVFKQSFVYSTSYFIFLTSFSRRRWTRWWCILHRLYQSQCPHVTTINSKYTVV